MHYEYVRCYSTGPGSQYICHTGQHQLTLTRPPNLVPSSVLIFERLCLETMECRRFSLKVTKVEEIATIVSLLFQASPTPTPTRRFPDFLFWCIGDKCYNNFSAHFTRWHDKLERFACGLYYKYITIMNDACTKNVY